MRCLIATGNIFTILPQGFFYLVTSGKKTHFTLLPCGIKFSSSLSLQNIKYKPRLDRSIIKSVVMFIHDNLSEIKICFNI